MIVEQLKRHIKETGQQEGGTVFRISGVGGCARSMYFKAIGLPPTNELEYEQVLTFARGHAAEEIIAPLMTDLYGDSIEHGGVCKVCPGRRQGLHAEVVTPDGIELSGHMDARIRESGVIVVDYKSVTPGGFNYRVKYGASGKNESQVNLYMHSEAQSGEEVKHGLLIYYDIAGGRLHGEVVEYNPEKAVEDMLLFDLVAQHAGDFYSAASDAEAAKGTEKYAELALEYAPGCVSSSPSDFPSSYTKNGKIFKCPYFELGCGGGDYDYDSMDAEGEVELDAHYEGVAQAHERAKARERHWKREKKKFNNMLSNALEKHGVKRGRAGDAIIKHRARSASGISKSKVPADVMAMIPDEAKWETKYSFVDVEMVGENDEGED